MISLLPSSRSWVHKRSNKVDSTRLDSVFPHILWHLETSGRIMGILSAGSTKWSCSAMQTCMWLDCILRGRIVTKDRPVRSHERSHKTIDFGLAYSYCVITNALPTHYIYIINYKHAITHNFISPILYIMPYLCATTLRGALVKTKSSRRTSLHGVCNYIQLHARSYISSKARFIYAVQYCRVALHAPKAQASCKSDLVIGLC